MDALASAAQAELAKTAETEERRQWIEAHGSERLKLCVELGVGCEQAYRNERLAATYPGWVWADTMPGRGHDPHDPPIEALHALRAARKADYSKKIDLCRRIGEDGWRLGAMFLGARIFGPMIKCTPGEEASGDKV